MFSLIHIFTGPHVTVGTPWNNLPLGFHRNSRKLPRRFPWFLKTGPTFIDNRKSVRRFTCLFYTMFDVSYVYFDVKCPERTNRDPSKIAIFTFLLSRFPCCVGIGFSLETVEENRKSKKQRALHFPTFFENCKSWSNQWKLSRFNMEIWKKTYFRASYWYIDNRTCPTCIRNFEPWHMLNV